MANKYSQSNTKMASLWGGDPDALFRDTVVMPRDIMSQDTAYFPWDMPMSKSKKDTLRMVVAVVLGAILLYMLLRMFFVSGADDGDKPLPRLLTVRVDNNTNAVTGVDERFTLRTHTMAHRKLAHIASLRRGIRAILYRHSRNEWVVLAGSALTVRPSVTGTIPVEYIPMTAPLIRHAAAGVVPRPPSSMSTVVTPAAAQPPSATPPPTSTAPTTNTAAMLPIMDPSDPQFNMYTNANLSIDALAADVPIQQYQTLAAAKAALPWDTATLQYYVVAGPASHPVFYVVATRSTANVQVIPGQSGGGVTVYRRR